MLLVFNPFVDCTCFPFCIVYFKNVHFHPHIIIPLLFILFNIEWNDPFQSSWLPWRMRFFCFRKYHITPGLMMIDLFQREINPYFQLSLIPIQWLIVFSESGLDDVVSRFISPKNPPLAVSVHMICCPLLFTVWGVWLWSHSQYRYFRIF